MIPIIRPLLTQSDSASRKLPFSPGFFWSFFFFFFLSHTSTFQLLEKPWSQVSSLPPGSCLQFLSRIWFSNSTAVRRFFIERCLLIVGRVDFIFFLLFLEGALPRGGWCEGVLLYDNRKSVGSSVLRAFFKNNACFAHDEPSSNRVGGVGLSRKPPTLVALHSAERREPPKLQQA